MGESAVYGGGGAEYGGGGSLRATQALWSATGGWHSMSMRTEEEVMVAAAAVVNCWRGWVEAYGIYRPLTVFFFCRLFHLNFRLYCNLSPTPLFEKISIVKTRSRVFSESLTSESGIHFNQFRTPDPNKNREFKKTICAFCFDTKVPTFCLGSSQGFGIGRN